ncbi:hypothetical protein D3C76_165240 [compost metagenome]
MPVTTNTDATKYNIQKTRYMGLGYYNQQPGLWRVVDIHDSLLNSQGVPRAVGPQYASKAELLSDLDRYARESWGYL